MLETAPAPTTVAVTPPSGSPTGPSGRGVVTAAARRRRTATAAVRRRRIATGLVALTAAAGAADVAGAVPTAAVVAVGLLAAAYLLAGAVARHRAVRREVARAFAAPGGDFDWAAFTGSGAAGLSVGEQRAAQDVASRADLVPFLAASLLGWALTPVVVAARLATGDRRDLEGDGALARLVSLQREGRSHSLRALAVSLATTAGVGAVGTLAGGLAAPIASAAPAPGTVTVVAGDTLSSIAAAHGTTVEALASANDLADPNLVYVGQVLVLPTGASGTSVAAVPSAASDTYTVQPGDTLSAIAASHNTTVAALAAADDLADPNVIDVGQVLIFPEGGAASTTSFALAPQRSGSGTYTVQPGDTLSAIAASQATTVAALVAANHLTDPNVIEAGQVLEVPGADGTAGPVAASATPAAVAPAAVAPAAVAPASVAPAAVATAGTSATAAAARALSVALAQVGKPYQWAGAGPDSFDCSGLVMYSYAAAGVSLPHYSVSQYQDTTRITESELEPGDLVFYGGSAPSHVALYAGGGQIVSADTTGTDVRVEAITWDGTPSGFGRVG